MVQTLGKTEDQSVKNTARILESDWDAGGIIHHC